MSKSIVVLIGTKAKIFIMKRHIHGERVSANQTFGGEASRFEGTDSRATDAMEQALKRFSKECGMNLNLASPTRKL